GDGNPSRAVGRDRGCGGRELIDTTHVADRVACGASRTQAGRGLQHTICRDENGVVAGAGRVAGGDRGTGTYQAAVGYRQSIDRPVVADVEATAGAAQD